MSARALRWLLTALLGIAFLILLDQGAASDPARDKDKSGDSRTKESKKIPSPQQLREGLLTAMSVDIENSTLEDVLKYLQEKTGVPIFISRVFLDKKVINLKAPVSVHLKSVSLRTVLRKVLAQVTKEEWEYTFGLRGVVITPPKLAAETIVYDVRDLCEQMPHLLPELSRWHPDLFRDLSPTDGPALLIRSLMDEADLRSWETVEFRNKSRLVVYACFSRQEAVEDHLKALRRLLDLAVVMNARLYEVDRAFYTKHIAPLFPTDKETDTRSVIVRIEAPLLKLVSKQKLLLESEEIKLRPTQEATFLAQENVFRYAASPDPMNKGRTLTGTGLAGVSFQVRPQISSDRRFLRLQISQQVIQLVGIEKTNRLDLSTGKEVAIEVPAIRKTTLTGTVQIPDAGPILMPVDYRPPGKVGKDKVWLLVARPYIWIKEEEEERGKPTPQASVWESEVPKDETPAPPETRLPSDRKTKALLQAVLKDVLTNPDLKQTRDFYGTTKDRTFTLVDGDKLGWPKKFQPETHGFNLVTVQLDPFKDQRRVLGISLSKFNLKQKKSDKLFDTPIEVEICNAGGEANGFVIGSCTVYYNVKRLHNRWIVEYYGVLDP